MDNPTEFAVLLISEMQINVLGHMQFLQLLWLVHGSPGKLVSCSSVTGS